MDDEPTCSFARLFLKRGNKRPIRGMQVFYTIILHLFEEDNCWHANRKMPDGSEVAEYYENTVGYG